LILLSAAAKATKPEDVLSPKAAAEAEIKIAAKRAKDAARKKAERGAPRAAAEAAAEAAPVSVSS